MDDTPEVIQSALRNAVNAPGYPTAAGTPALRQAWVCWAQGTLGVELDDAQVAPTIGSKEVVAWLGTLLGLNTSSTVAIPELAYPTYAVGGMICGAKVVTYRTSSDIPSEADLVWVNSPSNPSGEVLGVDELRAIVEVGRNLGAPVVGDECYFELGWTADPVSVLDPRVCGETQEGVLAVHSLSKRSNLAGYRSGAVLGDAVLVQAIIGARKHTGMLLPSPIQQATIAALDDSQHVADQKLRYANRRDVLHTALTQAGFTIEHSQAGLYLWTTRNEDCMETVNWFANNGILVAPGSFYGTAGDQYVRVALTATDERIASAASRLAAL